jgi:hypothetical protein
MFLLMSGYDIADYLALAVAIMSCCLTELRIRQTISFRGVQYGPAGHISGRVHDPKSLKRSPGNMLLTAPFLNRVTKLTGQMQ